MSVTTIPKAVVAAVTVSATVALLAVTGNPAAAETVAPGATCTTARAQFNASNLATSPMSIPDNDGTHRRIAVDVTSAGSGATIWDVELALGINHPYGSDLKVWLEAPDGTTALVTDRNGHASGGNHFYDVVFDDQAAGSIVDYPFDADVVGIPVEVQPEESFAAKLRGHPVDGRWYLHVEDLATGDTGEVRLWGQIITACSPPQAAEPAPTPTVNPPVPRTIKLTGTCGARRAAPCRGTMKSLFRFTGTTAGDGSVGSEVEVVATQLSGTAVGKRITKVLKPTGAQFSVRAGAYGLVPGLWSISAQYGGQTLIRTAPRFVLVTGKAPTTPQRVSL